MKIIDAHNHPDWHGKDLERFLQDMDAKNIEKTRNMGYTVSKKPIQ